MDAAVQPFRGGLRERLRTFIERPSTQRATITLILINAALLGMETWPAAMQVAGDSIKMPDRTILAVFLVATFTMLNLFIAITVNAMQSYSDAEHQETVQALQETQDHIAADLHGELRALRAEIGELKRMLAKVVVAETADRSPRNHSRLQSGS